MEDMKHTYLQRKALEWVNARRAEDGNPPLEDLLLGRPHQPGHCTLANSLGQAYVVDARHYWRAPDGPRLRLPFLVAMAVRRFDLSPSPKWRRYYGPQPGGVAYQLSKPPRQRARPAEAPEGDAPASPAASAPLVNHFVLNENRRVMGSRMEDPFEWDEFAEHNAAEAELVSH